jgi:sodium pump decarboxylase gamma subunit
MMNMLSLTAPVTMLSGGDMALGDRVAYAGQLTLIGMVTIFAVLALLLGAISVMRVLLQDKNNPKKKAVSQNNDVMEMPAAVTPAPQPAHSVNDDAALLAAITAAIAVVWEAEHPGTGFRVVSYRHADKRSAWNKK